MKKRFAGVLAALLVLVMGTTTAFAASSPTAEEALKKNAEELAKKVSGATATSSTGTAITLTRKTAATSDVTDANSVANTKGTNPQMLAVVEIETNADKTTVSKGITVTIQVADVKAGDNVYVLHKLSDGTWETLKPSAVGAGYVKVTMYSLSPVAVVRYAQGTTITPTQQQPNGSTTTDTTNTTTNTNSNNTTGDSTSQSNSQSNNNDQSNSQSNNQNNPVNVEQNVTVNYPEYDAAESKPSGSSNWGTSGAAGTGVDTVTTETSPKTGAALPALPFVAVFAAAGMVACGRKARENE